MKVSVVCILRNEEKNIGELIESLRKQIYKPYEIIFINDDSTDNTEEIIKTYTKKDKRIKLLRVNNHNISKNRNFGISKSGGDFILTIDGGCSVTRDYLSNLVECYKNNQNHKFFGGVTKIPYSNSFEHCYSLLLERVPSPNYLPKGHAFFFKKKLWENVEGFNEDLRTAEDTEFISKAKKINQPPIICEKALVYWKPRKNFKEIYKQFYNYGEGDRKAFGINNLPFKSKVNLLITIIFPLSIFHAFFISFKLLWKTKKFSSIFIGFVMDLTKIYAYSLGLVLDIIHHN